MNTLGDLRRLSVHVDDNLALVAVDSVIVGQESDLLKGLSGDLLKRDLVFVDRHLTKKHNHSCLGGGFHGNLGVGVDLEASVDDGIRDRNGCASW
jgi:hypothetical protein